MADTTQGLQRLLQAAWLKPLIFLALLVALWDVAIRVFHIPPYQVPAPYDVVVTLWTDWPLLLQEAWPTTVATLWGFLLSAAFGIPDRHADRGFADGRELCLSAAGVLPVDPEDRRSRRCSSSGSASA